MSWTPAFPLSELPRSGARLLRTDTHRVAVFRLDGDEVLAVDNACPHEGYPLVQGEVKERVLTCAWHNFKFDLRTGACLKGDEDVRAYATRVREGMIEVDLTAPDPARVVKRARASLEEGLLEGQTGRMARDVVRLLQAGVPAVQLLADGAGFDARHAEYGTTHATPVACDLIEYLDGDTAHDALVLMQLMELASDANVRRPERSWPEPVASADLVADLSAAIEHEEVDRALALVRGAADPVATARALLHCASAHFLGFGHPLIYTTKVLELFEHDDRHATDILCALALRIVSSTREDTLPPMKRWREWADTHAPRRGTSDLATADVAALAARIVDPDDRTIEDEFLDHLAGDTAATSLVDALVIAAGERFLRFDPSIHEDWTVQDDWLSVTHLLTYAHAIREALDRTDDDQVLLNLVWSLAFIRRSHRLDLAEPVTMPAVPATADDIVAALAHSDPRVVALADGWLQSGADVDELGSALREWLLAGRATRPIVIAHQIKTLRVALQEAELRTPLLATLRFLATPLTERGMRGTVHDAAELVLHGNLPKLRAS